MTTATHSPQYEALSPRRQRFIDALQVEATQGAAALSAGYSDVSQASRLLENDAIRDALRAEREVNARQSGASPQFVLGRLTVLAQCAKAERDQIRALELIGKATGMFVKRVEIGGTIAHVHVLAGISDDDLTDLVAELRARRDAPALVEGTATVVDEPRDGEGDGPAAETDDERR